MFNHPIWSSVWHTIKHNKLLSLSLILSVVGSVVFAVIPPLVLEKVIYGLTENRRIELSIALLYFGFLALVGITDALRGVFIASFGQKTTSRLRAMMALKLELLPQSYFTSNEAGKILSRFTVDIDTIDTLFRSGVISMVVDLFKIIFILFVIFTKSIGLSVLLLFVTPIIFGVSMHFKKKMHAAQMDNRRALAKINNHIPETLKNIRTIHTLKKEEYMKKRFRKYVDESFDAFERTYFYEAMYTPIISEISVLIIATLMVFSSLGGVFQTFFGMHVSTAVAVMSCVTKIFSPIESLGMEIQNIQSALAGVHRIGEFFSEKEKPKQDIEDLSAFDWNKNAIECNNLTFSYGDNLVLDSINFTVKHGEKVAFIGRTGAGKTTVYRLILGLFEPDGGDVLIFGVKASKICDSLKRKIFGYAEQGVKLVMGSVREQINLGDKSITDDQVYKALDMVGLSELVNSFSLGLNEPAREDMFSQGQLQLLSVARAVVCDPKILLLDEITAHLDSETEAQITNAIVNASKSRTVLNISHRMGDIHSDARIIDITNLG